METENYNQENRDIKTYRASERHARGSKKTKAVDYIGLYSHRIRMYVFVNENTVFKKCVELVYFQKELR